MVAVQTVLEELVVRVYVVQDGVCIRLMACCEHNHLELLVRFLQALHKIGPQIDASADCLFARKVNLQDHIGVLCVYVIYTVNECLVHVKD